ncbi:helix-turn-helix transcriptional regulator [Tsukamurella tyrosinosolvens]|nr:helix-turn-helix transcriptional regulator [Tsukamurella tyrosinosolvens]
MDIQFFRQDFAETAEWTIAAQRHEVLIWRSGTARSKEFAFESGASGRIEPKVSSVWVVPAGDKSTASAQHAEYDFARVSLPVVMSESTILKPVVARRDPLLHNVVERVASAAGRDDVVSRLLVDSLLDVVRLHILDQYGVRTEPRCSTRSLDASAQRRVLERINDGTEAELDLSALAEAEGMSPDAFRRAFARAFRTTPHRYLMDRRIARSKGLLVTTTLSITEISEALGFASPSHFATTFKRRVGRSPSAYRAAP